MFDDTFQQDLTTQLQEIRLAGLWKSEHALLSPQSNRIAVGGREGVLNFCANNYLGLADHPALISAATQALQTRGFGMASVRFICGSQDLHLELERRLSAFLGMDDTILYSSCFDANGGLFETMLSAEDAVISDQLNHASIIDGVRLCKARRFVYPNNDMGALEERLREAREAGARRVMIATDGVFSMDGGIADLGSICDLADNYQALVMVDDSHAVGFLGMGGRGTHEHAGVMGRVDILTGTMGKALGGASGGYTSGRKDIIDLLRQRSRPYLFSNSIAPSLAAATIAALDLLESDTILRTRLWANTERFRRKMEQTGLQVLPGIHPIAPVMLGEAELAQRFAARMFERGVYVVGFFFPVVARGLARIRTQVSAAHTFEDIDFAVENFAATAHELGVI